MATTRTRKESEILPEKEDQGKSYSSAGYFGGGSRESHDPSTSALIDSAWDSSAESFNWDDWGRRTEGHWVKVAKTMETAMWFSIGAMLGTFAGGIPGTMIPNYAFFLWQPLGAAVGALVALYILRRGERPYRPSFRIRRNR